MTELVVVAVIVAAVAGQPASRFDRDVVRLRAHFAQVDRELRERDVSHLTAAQQQARATHIARLREYASRGVFPKNTRHPGFVPYFVDDAGTRCAMAYLVEQSGAGEFVSRVAGRINNAYIAEIARDPDLGAPLVAWLEASGLTLDEAARIQPAYDGGGCCTIPDDQPPPPVTTGYKVGSGAAIVSGLTTVALNASLVRLGLSRRTGGWVGLGAGVAGLALAASAMDKGEEYGTLRLVNTGVGVLAAGVGLYAILSRGPSAEPQLAAAPWVAPDGRSGVQVHLRF